MKLRTIIYTLLLATLCMGCGGRISMRQLEQLEARMNDAPDSVLAVLTATDMPRWGEARALYALLTVQAQDKSYIDVADDSLICVATDYYEHKGQPLHRLQAFYYHGLVHGNAGRRHEAMTAYTRAKEFADEVDAPYPTGLLYLQLGVLYGNDYDYQRALIHMKAALTCFETANKERLQYIVKRNLGQLYLDMENAPRARSLLKEVLEWGELQGDSYLIKSTLSPLIRLYDATKNVEALDSVFKNYSIEFLSKNATTYTIIAHYYALKGDGMAADKALCQAWEISSTPADAAKLWHKSYQVNKALGRTEVALNDHERLFELQDSTVRITLQQPLIASQRDHYETRLKVEELRNQQQRYLMRGAAVIILMVAVALGIYVRSCFRRKQEELNEYMELAEDLRYTLYNKEESIGRISEELQLSHVQMDELRERVDAHEGSVVHMQAQIAELFDTYSRLLNNLSETYYENQGTKSAINKGILSQLEKEIVQLSKGDKLAELEAILNTNLDNIMHRLRAELPYLKEKDYTFLTYLYARFSGKTIATFMKLERNHIYQIKHRLRDEIKASNAPSKHFFLDKMM
jgi:tetratricopeptide (TPR) repeat protein